MNMLRKCIKFWDRKSAAEPHEMVPGGDAGNQGKILFGYFSNVSLVVRRYSPAWMRQM